MRVVPFRALLLLLLAALMSGCGYNTIQQKDEAVKAGWSEVLIGVTEARAKVSQINVNADDAASLAQYQAAQGQLTQALGRLMVVTENYPDLKADTSFLNLQTQLEGTENRITVARGRYIQLVQDYNTYIRQFPVNLTAKVFGYEQKPNFAVENEAQIQDAPNVDFNQATPAQPQPAPQPAQPAQPAPQPAPAG